MMPLRRTRLMPSSSRSYGTICVAYLTRAGVSVRFGVAAIVRVLLSTSLDEIS